MTGADREKGEGEEKKKGRHLGRRQTKWTFFRIDRPNRKKGKESYEEDEKIIEHPDGSDYDVGHGGSGVRG